MDTRQLGKDPLPPCSLLMWPGNHLCHCSSRTCQNQAQTALPRGRRAEECSFPLATYGIWHTHLLSLACTPLQQKAHSPALEGALNPFMQWCITAR